MKSLQQLKSCTTSIQEDEQNELTEETRHDNRSEIVHKRKITSKLLAEFIDQDLDEHGAKMNKKTKRHINLISNQSIEHCVNRLLSMSQKALETRIKKIFAAAGKHVIEKLLVFYYALTFMCYEDLARLAKDSLVKFEILIP